MKKIFVAMLALAAAAACSNEEIVSVNREAIAFDNAFINNSVRSVIDPSYKYDTKMFADFAVYGFVSADNQEPAAIFKCTQVSGPAWTYVGTQYWMDGADYTFHAVAPLTSGNWTNAVATTDGVSLTFNNTTANGAFKGENDLLYATNDYGEYNYVADTAVGKVGFTFRHVLSKVKFSFKNTYNASNTKLAVKNIFIQNAYKTADVALTANNTVWDRHIDPTLELQFQSAGTTQSGGQVVPTKLALNEEAESFYELLIIPGAVPTFVNANGETVTGYKVVFAVDVYVNDTLVKTYDHEVAANFTPVAGYSYDLKAEISHENLDPEQTQEAIEFTVTSIDGWANGNTADSDDDDNVKDHYPLPLN